MVASYVFEFEGEAAVVPAWVAPASEEVVVAFPGAAGFEDELGAYVVGQVELFDGFR